jgi:hypothetical protein
MEKRAIWSATGLLMLLLAMPLCAADKEDLSAVKVPSGQVTVPEAEAARPDQGYVYRFSDGKFFRIGQGGDVNESPQQTFERMKRERDGDLIYSKAGGGSLMALSGRIMDLGTHPLAYFLTGELPAPRANSTQVSRIAEGSVYLLQGTDHNFILIRLLGKTDSDLSIQYLYQPDGSLDFTKTTAVVPPAPAPTQAATSQPAATAPATTVTASVAGPAAPPPSLPVAPAIAPTAPAEPEILQPPPEKLDPVTPPSTILMPYIETHLRQRAELVQNRIETIRAGARTNADVRNKALAMDDLRKLQATEAIPALIDEISFLNPHASSPGNHLSMEAFHPAVAALEGLGKPASLAALKAIGILHMDNDQIPANGDATRTPSYKLHLLVAVMASVEGPDVAGFLLRREAGKADAAHRQNYDAALRELGQ